ncbi:MAG: isochorismatase family protein [Actinobacteria bacterium]|nr:isochorismatase family protein [Actinomycetota bacterium]
MPLLDRDDCVLVVVDAQPGFLPPDAAPAVERMAWLVAVAARLGVPVVVTEEEPERNGATDSRIAAFLPDGAPVFTKPTFGLAGTPEILAAVRATARGTAVVVGAETDVCVAQSAIGLGEEGLACVAVEDATFSPGEMHTRGLARMAAEGVALNHAKGVTYEWLRTVADAHAVLHDRALPPAPFRL